MIKRLGVILSALTLILLFSYNTSYADEKPDYKEITCGSTGFVYYDEMFLVDANELSTDIAKMSAALADAAYHRDRINAVLSDLNGMGFTCYDNEEVYTRSKSGLTINDNDYVAYTISYKVVGEYIVYLVPIKGSSKNAEWYSNFHLGHGNTHQGFQTAAEEVYIDLLGKMAEDSFNADKHIILLTGHSRGAAVANLIAGWLTENQAYAFPEHIFAYTFACPSVSKTADESYTNIYNYNNPGDLIPLLPLERWGYRRYGITIDTISETVWDNIANRYGGSFPCESDPNGYLTLLNGILSDQSSFYLPTYQFIFNVFAYGLGGSSNSTLSEVVQESGLSVGSYILKRMLASHPVVWVFNESNTLINSCEQDIQFILDHEEEAATMTETEFATFVLANSSYIKRIEDKTGITISDANGFISCKDILRNLQNEARNLVSSLKDLFELFFDGNGNILDKITYGHQQDTYLYWINSIYYGYAGWNGNNENTCPTIPSNVSSIGAYCFNSSSICECLLHNDLRYLGKDSFEGALNLKNITIPGSVSAIGPCAFKNCTNLESIQIKQGVQVIGASAFYNCTSLGFIIIPEGAQQIGGQAFQGCSGLESVVISDSVRSIGLEAFRQCPNLTFLQMPCDVKLNSKVYSNYSLNHPFIGSKNVSKIVLSKGETGIVGSGEIPVGDTYGTDWDQCPLGQIFADTLKEVVFEEGITEIQSMFCGSSKQNDDGEYVSCIEKIVLPTTLRIIGKDAFKYQDNLAKVSLPENLQEIGFSAFYKCSGLESIELPEKLKSIGFFAFAGCKKIETVKIPNGVEFIGGSAFSGASSLREAQLPGDVVYVIGDEHYYDSAGSSPFDNCDALNKVVYTFGKTGVLKSGYVISDNNWGNSFYTIAYSAKSTLREAIIEDGITEIKKGVFAEASALTALYIPPTTTAISNTAVPKREDLIVFGIKDSYAEAFALSNNNSFIALNYPYIEAENKRMSLGSSQQLNATVYTSLHQTKNDVEWGVYGNSNAATFITENGQLSIAQEETSKDITITAKYGDYINTIQIQIHIHAFVLEDENPATCEETGIKAYWKCSECGALFADENGTVEIEAPVVISALGHKLMHIDGQIPTCETEGWLEHWKCERCGHLFADAEGHTEISANDAIIPATGHTHGEEQRSDEIPATCIEGGSYVRMVVCTVCGKELVHEKVTVPAFGHDYEWTILEPATCGTAGLREGICSACGETETEEIRATGEHTYTITTTKASLTSDGMITEVCDVCGETTAATISHPETFKLSATSYTYNGSAKKPTVTVTDADGEKIDAANYTVSYTNNTKAGTATAKVTFKGNYSGTKSLTFKIKAKAITPTVTLSATSYTWNGKVKKPTVTVKSGSTVIDSANYTVTYASGRKNVGSYKVTVTMKGNYSGSKAVTFTINPKGTTVKSLTAASKAITVKWTKQETKMSEARITGYQIQLATDSKFTKNVKTVTVSGYSSVSKKVTSLKGGVKYYVRIRTYKTISSTKYYSPWSTVKTTTTKK